MWAIWTSNVFAVHLPGVSVIQNSNRTPSLVGEWGKKPGRSLRTQNAQNGSVYWNTWALFMPPTLILCLFTFSLETVLTNLIILFINRIIRWERKKRINRCNRFTDGIGGFWWPNRYNNEGKRVRWRHKCSYQDTFTWERTSLGYLSSPRGGRGTVGSDNNDVQCEDFSPPIFLCEVQDKSSTSAKLAFSVDSKKT